jgi:DNA-binding transcriptional LysR family regulator
MDHLSLGKLEQLIAVARCGSFSKAAVELSISQPALSRSVAAIEERYGFQIFSRVGHGVHLTAAGIQVLEQAQPLLHGMRTFDNNLKLFGSGKAGQLSLGFTPLLASQVLSQFAIEFFTASSNVHLSVVVRPGSVLLDELKNDTIEMIFCTESQLEPSSEIDTEAIGGFVPICVVRRAHPMANRRELKLRDLIDYPWASAVDPPFDSATSRRISGGFLCENFHVLREAVLATNLVYICTSDFIAQELASGALVQLRVGDLKLRSTKIMAAKLRGRISSPLAEQALKRMKMRLGQHAATRKS